MTDEMTCIWRGTEEPRAIKGRHLDACDGTDCSGCEPCAEQHCAICGIEHCDTGNPITCPRCVGAVRDDLEQITDMHARLESEAINMGTRGDRDGTVLGGDAMVMLAMTHREQTGAAADGDHTHESAADPVPPLLTLATWEDAWRDHLEHDQAGTASVDDAAAYLDLMLTRMAQDFSLPFDDFARDIRRTRSRLEDVLHDGVREETGAPCPQCDRALVKRYGRSEHFDRWVCPSRSCGTWYLDAEYRRWVTYDYRANADRLTANDMAALLGVKASVVRVWGARGLVRKRGRNSSGITLYDVADARKRHEEEPKSA